jgi:hypothetical protein
VVRNKRVFDQELSALESLYRGALSASNATKNAMVSLPCAPEFQQRHQSDDIKATGRQSTSKDFKLRAYRDYRA